MKKYIFMFIIILTLSMFMTCGPSGPLISYDPEGGFQDSTVNVEITVTDELDDSITYDIYYTLDGSSPTTSSTPYTGPIEISSGEVDLKSLAVGGGKEVTYSAEYGFGEYGYEFIMKNHDGKAISLDDFKGKVDYLHIVFSADWCGYCHQQAGTGKADLAALKGEGIDADSITVLSQNASGGGSISDSTLNNWYTSYGLKYIVADYNEGTREAYNSAHSFGYSYPTNLVLEYDSTTGDFEFVGYWKGVLPFVQAFLDTINE